MPRTKRLLVAATFAVGLLLDATAQQLPQMRFAEPVPIGDGQRKLLAAEAQRLSGFSLDSSQQLKTMEAKNTPFSAMGETLSGHAGSGGSAVTKTRDAFLQLSGDNTIQRQAAQSFFNYFVTRYAALSGQAKMVQQASYPPTRDRTFQLLDENQRAYNAVAMAGSLTFNLSVRSIPPQAAVAYKRDGDQYQDYNSNTDTTIENLLYAVWTVRATLSGKQQEQRHDANSESNHVLIFNFTK